MKIAVRRGLWAAALLIAGVPSFAGQAWIETGDADMRDDLQWLADTGAIDLPLAAWPIPVADIERALGGLPIEPDISSIATDIVLARVRRALRPRLDGSLRVDFLGLSGGREGMLRDFDSASRDDGDVTLGIAALGDRWAAEVRGRLAISSSDHQAVRLDGSHLTLRFGNWLFSANTLERWWGPGHVSSLILSNNARPIPALTLDRATSGPFGSRLLRWIGPWRFTSILGEMEGHREDVNKPLFLAMRVSLRPFRFVEIGLSRSAQFCGEGRRCTLGTLADVIGFNDTAGVTVAPEDEPGNQLAGYDLRIVSPWRSVPLALYSQRIGEDRINIRPTDKLDQYGIEGWHALANGGVLRAYVEYSDTACAGTSNLPNFNCAYNHHIFFEEGYRFRGRSVGHTTDGDAQLRAAGVHWTRASGRRWTLEFRDAALNRDPVPDPRNTVSEGPSDYQSVELGWRADLFDGKLQVQLGMERSEPAGSASSDRVYGFLSWIRQL